jgi:5-methylthioadenosine/S-adenosylhomocysteine deaminase
MAASRRGPPARVGGKLLRGDFVVSEPAAAGGGLIAGGAVAVEGDRVVAVGRFDELHQRYPASEVIGGDGRVVLPGLVDGHHHGWGLSPFQLGALDDRLELWLVDLMALPPVDPYLDALHAAMRLLRSGVTCVAHFGISRDPARFETETREALRAYEDSGLRVSYAVQARDRNSFVYEDDEAFLGWLPAGVAESARSALGAGEWPTADESLALVVELAERYASHPRIRVLPCTEGPEWCSDELLLALRETATRLGTGLHLHALESPLQRELALREHGRPALERLDELGLLGPDVAIAHGVWLTEAEMDLCARRGVTVCHNPSSNLRLCCGVLPLGALVERGVDVALGTDSTALNDDDDMLQEMRLAAKLHRMPGGRPPSSLDVLRMATTNGARLVGRAGEVGTLAPGARADALLLDMAAAGAPHVAPAAGVVDAVLYRAGRAHVDTVMVGGEVVLSGGRFVTLDEAHVHARLAESARERPSAPATRRRDALAALRPHVEGFYDGWPEPAHEPSYRPNSP